MSIFRPPTDDFVPLALPPSPESSQEQRLAFGLFRHYANDPRGRNVFKLDDGTYTENEPGDMTVVVKIYWGGSDNVVSELEVAELTAAGYGAYIT